MKADPSTRSPRSLRRDDSRGLSTARLFGISVLTAASLLGGCGDGRLDKVSSASGSFTVVVERVSFPRHQTLAQSSQLQLTVRNAGERTLPNVAVSVNSFSYRNRQRGFAEHERPLWTVDRGPRGETAFVSTWALGKLRPGARKTFRWTVTPVRAGTHTLKYTVAATVIGPSKTRLPSGAAAEGALTVNVDSQPPTVTVAPDRGGQ